MGRFLCGYVSIIGETNVGKSTLINRLIGEKIAIVSPKTQTTRSNTLGIYNDETTQIVFVDTPGIHKSKTKIDEFMNENISRAGKDADVILLVLDAKKNLTEQYKKFSIRQKVPVILVINKIDETTFEKLYPQIDAISKISEVKEILPISALKGKNCDILIELIKQYLPSYDAEMRYYPIEQFTDKTQKELVAEIIREKVLYQFEQEVPHGVAVEIAGFDEKENIINILANIIVEKQSHKNIIIGKNGEAIKKLSITARKDIENLLQNKIYLELFVKVKSGWRDNAGALRELGFKIDKSE